MEEQHRQFILSLLAYAVQRGVSARHICHLCNIDLEKLKNASIELSRKQFNDLWRNASHLLDDPLFGLHLGESLQLAALGAVGEIIKTSETVGQAIGIAASLTKMVTDAFTMQASRTNKTFTISLLASTNQNDEFIERQWADLLMVFTIHELNGLVLEKIAPRSVTRKYKIEDRKEYERIFRCKKMKKGNTYSMKFDNRFWDVPILTANYELHKLFIEKLNSKERDRLTSSRAFKAKVLGYLMQNSYLGVLSLEDVAANFNLTARSLQRKLQEEETTFHQLADSVKKSLAIQLIKSGHHQIKEISIMLGYNELSAFSRAFKRWTGRSPMHY